MKNLSDSDISRVIEMAWEDRTPFDAIEAQFSIKEQEVIEIMRREMKESSFKMWRKESMVKTRSIYQNALFLLEGIEQKSKAS